MTRHAHALLHAPSDNEETGPAGAKETPKALGLGNDLASTGDRSEGSPEALYALDGRTVFSCEYDCGFVGGFEQVAAHESICKLNPYTAKHGKQRENDNSPHMPDQPPRFPASAYQPVLDSQRPQTTSKASRISPHQLAEGIKGKIQVKCERADGLPKMDSYTQRADKSLSQWTCTCPYLVVTVDQVSYRTSSKKNTLKPLWNETLSFDGVAGLSILHVEMFDQESIGKDRSMGSFSTTLHGFASKAFALNGTLFDKRPACGFVYLSVNFLQQNDGVAAKNRQGGVDSFSDELTRPEDSDVDVPFLPPPVTRQDDTDLLPTRVTSQLLEPEQTLAVTPERDGRNSRVRIQAGKEIVQERRPANGIANAPPRYPVPSPDPDRQSKKEVEDVLSRLEALSPRNTKKEVEDVLSRLEARSPRTFFGTLHSKGKTPPGTDNDEFPVTQFSTRTAEPRPTPVTMFSSRGTRAAPATGFGSLYSPRHRAANVPKLNLSHGGAQSLAPSSRSAETNRSVLTPRLELPDSLDRIPVYDGDHSPVLINFATESPDDWLGRLKTRKPSRTSDASPPMRTDRPVPAAASKRGDLADALSSDEESDAESHESDELLDDAAVKFVVPPPGAVKAMRRELARRANSVTQAMRHEWATQILSETKAKYDKENRGLRPVFKEWKFLMELNTTLYHMLALEVRRNNRRMLWRFLQAWYSDSHGLHRMRTLISRERRKRKARQCKAYFHNWKLFKLRGKRYARILLKLRRKDLSYFFNFWADDVDYLAWRKHRILLMQSKRSNRLLHLSVTGMLDVIKSKQHMSLFSGVLCRDLLTETVVWIHAWRDYCREIWSLKTRGRRCEFRWLIFEMYSVFHGWLHVMTQERHHRAKKRRAHDLRHGTVQLKFLTAWFQVHDRMRYLENAGVTIFQHHDHLLLRNVFFGMYWSRNSSEVQRKRLTALLEKHINRIVVGVFRAWFAMIYDARMNFRSHLRNKHFELKTLTAVWQAWHVRHLFWHRLKRKFKVLEKQFRRDLQKSAFSRWKTLVRKLSSGEKKIKLAHRLHNARLCRNTLKTWDRRHQTYTRRVFAAAGNAIQSRELGCIGFALKGWKMHVDKIATRLVKKGRLTYQKNTRTAYYWLHTWRKAVEFNDKRSLEFERARLRVNRSILYSVLDLWVFGHSCFRAQVKGMEQVLHANKRRYRSEHLNAWRGLVEYFFRREVVVQQKALRRAYAIAGDVMRQWNLLTNKHFKTFEESSTQTECKSSDKAVETMRHKLLLKSCWGMYKLWVQQHRFVKYAANVCLIFQRRSVRSVFQLWLLARKMERQLDALARRWWDNDMTMYVHQWRLKTVKNKRSSAFMIRGEERCLRGLLQDWRKIVDVRKSLALKFGLLKQKFVRDTRFSRRTFQEFKRVLQNRIQQKHLQRLLQTRMQKKHLVDATRFLHEQTKRQARIKRKYVRCVAMVSNRNLHSCWSSWRRWVFTKRQAIDAVDRIFDHDDF